MKQAWALALVLASFTCAPAFAQTNSALTLSKYAPADEYFGPLQMSILGIRNQLQDMDRLYRASPDEADAILGKVAMAEASLRDWESKYPNDPALARYVYQLCKLYQKINVDFAREKSVDAHMWLFSRYAQTSYAKDELRHMSEEQSMHAGSDQSAVK
jgi:hypothetical protein